MKLYSIGRLLDCRHAARARRQLGAEFVQLLHRAAGEDAHACRHPGDQQDARKAQRRRRVVQQQHYGQDDDSDGHHRHRRQEQQQQEGPVRASAAASAAARQRRGGEGGGEGHTASVSHRVRARHRDAHVQARPGAVPRDGRRDHAQVQEHTARGRDARARQVLRSVHAAHHQPQVRGEDVRRRTQARHHVRRRSAPEEPGAQVQGVPERGLQRRPAVRRDVSALSGLLQGEREHGRGPTARRSARRRVLRHLAREVPPAGGDGQVRGEQAAARHAARRLERDEGQAHTQSHTLPRRRQRDTARARQEEDRRAHRRGPGGLLQAREQAAHHYRVRRLAPLPRRDPGARKFNYQ